ncbi:SRPBCC domain-containing protein [Amycolatopsis anabasis]|uniref:SRPBCC domain-containing protein n=1 Tax=Amycolatopsis anabasis TaxID=1840409 RepID=UPI00131AB0F5|nr:SRPBCC domain-containing protein [Amycolatopsis anabasis]
MNANGTLHQVGTGRLLLRFERRFAHPPEKVWRALTETAELAGWFPVSVLDFDPAPGARLRFDLTAEARRRMDIPADQDTVSTGRITLADPPKVLEYTWDTEVLRWELTADGAGGCVLVFTDTFDAPGEAPEFTETWAADMASGWHVSFEVLAEHLEGHQVTWSVWDRAAEFHQQYLAAPPPTG